MLLRAGHLFLDAPLPNLTRLHAKNLSGLFQGSTNGLALGIQAIWAFYF
jgi:hypothetical protein